MADISSSILIGVLVLFGIVIALVISSRRTHRDLRAYLEPDLRTCGVELVSAVHPGVFKVGPFPKFELEVGRPQSQVGGVRGEYNSYRLMTFRDADGNLHEIWAVVEFERFKFRRVRWKAEQKDELPQCVLSLLEA